MKTRGIFIVIEGIDGAGTTTQAERLHGDIRDRFGGECLLTREPSDGPVGRLIRELLEKRIAPLRDAYGDELAERDTLSLLFTADRMDHLRREIVPALQNGSHVVSDRYFHSTCAYQMKDAEHLDWILALHKYAPAPDLTIYIDLPPENALERIRGRAEHAPGAHAADGPQLFETRAQLERIRDAYAKVISRLTARGDRIAAIDGRPDADSVHAAIMREIGPLLSGKM